MMNSMKIDAVAVSSSDLKKTLAFYTCLGFEFADLEEGQQHVEPKTSTGSARLMIDSQELMQEIIGEQARPGNHSSFAIRFEQPDQVNQACEHVVQSGFTVVKEPWDAFWGQRYAIVEDPDGYRFDLYCPLDS